MTETEYGASGTGAAAGSCTAYSYLTAGEDFRRFDLAPE
jgi:hypothetical protein